MPIGGYENITTAIDVFLRYGFIYLVSKSTAVNTVKVVMDITTSRVCLLTLIVTEN